MLNGAALLPSIQVGEPEQEDPGVQQDVVGRRGGRDQVERDRYLEGADENVERGGALTVDPDRGPRTGGSRSPAGCRWPSGRSRSGRTGSLPGGRRRKC